jgi:hypothetical protein
MGILKHKKQEKRGTGGQERGGLGQGICTQGTHLCKLHTFWVHRASLHSSSSGPCQIGLQMGDDRRPQTSDSRSVFGEAGQQPDYPARCPLLGVPGEGTMNHA